MSSKTDCFESYSCFVVLFFCSRTFQSFSASGPFLQKLFLGDYNPFEDLLNINFSKAFVSLILATEDFYFLLLRCLPSFLTYPQAGNRSFKVFTIFYMHFKNNILTEEKTHRYGRHILE